MISDKNWSREEGIGNFAEMTEDNPIRSLNVLVVDDEANIRKTLAVCLESHGHRVTAVSNEKDARVETDRQVFDLAFVDLRLGTENDLDLIPPILGASPWTKIVVITAYASVETAVEAIRRGATDHIPKPFPPEQVQLVTDRAATKTLQEAANILGIDQATLWHKRKQYGI
jgi:two-component system, NtrC family, response regulator AlgB